MCKTGVLVFLDYCQRIVRQICGDVEWIFIPRHRCDNPNCRRIHRMLPDFLVPFKHYQEEVIADCIDGRLDAEDTEENPSVQTINRWKYWIQVNADDINGSLKSIGHRELGFSEELLRSGISLLEKLRSSIPDGWLRMILRVIYNAGGRIIPLYD